MSEQTEESRPWMPYPEYGYESRYVIRAPVIRMRKVAGSHPRLRRVAVDVAGLLNHPLHWMVEAGWRIEHVQNWILSRTQKWGEHSVYDGTMPPGSLQYKPFDTDVSDYPEHTDGDTDES